MFQYFQWHSPSDGSLWGKLERDAELLAERGVTSVWIPPSYKSGASTEDVGYSVYDMFDLGEFDQKGSVRTKYGTKDQLLAAIKSLQYHKINVYADVVFNHRIGGDETEEVTVVEVDPNDRTRTVSEPYRVKTWSKFAFPGRGGKHSGFVWHAEHFTAFDAVENFRKPGTIYRLVDKAFADDVDGEKGNFDYLLGCDVDVRHPKVIEDLQLWGRWFIDTTGVDGFRLDAVKHIPSSFFRDWLHHLRTHFGNREIVAFAEYWSPKLADLKAYLHATEGVTKLFDVPLHFRFLEASKTGKDFDLSKVFEGTLTASDPLLSVSFVDNHDSEPGCSLESFVDAWFKPLAYGLILLRQEGYPCVFHADYFGGEAQGCTLPSHRMLLDVMLDARRKYCYGDQHDHFDHKNCIAWVRTGNEEHPGSMVVVMSNGDDGWKRLQAFAKNAVFRDLTGHIKDEVRTDDNGEGDFRCNGRSLSIWGQA
jgi:alpha-amylase